MTLRERKRLAAVYLRAAKAVNRRDDYSCNAVSQADGVPPYARRCAGSARARYVAAFLPSLVWLEPAKDMQAIRVLMLLFARQLALTGDL